MHLVQKHPRHFLPHSLNMAVGGHPTATSHSTVPVGRELAQLYPLGSLSWGWGRERLWWSVCCPKRIFSICCPCTSRYTLLTFITVGHPPLFQSLLSQQLMSWLAAHSRATCTAGPSRDPHGSGAQPAQGQSIATRGLVLSTLPRSC